MVGVPSPRLIVFVALHGRLDFPRAYPPGVPFGAETSGGSSLSLVTPRGVVCSDMADWRRFGRAPDFSGRKMKGVMAKTTGCPMTRKGSGMGLSKTGLGRNDWIIP